MGRLAIRQVEYFGDKWEFSSPFLGDGLVIVEGANGSGKTTFADLVYFGLGGAVPKFKKSSSEQHREVTGDTNNGVRLVVEIDGTSYTLTRRFEAPEEVQVTAWHDGDVQVLPIWRHNERRVLSDWILDTLNIDVVTLHSGRYKGKLNFVDIMRLMYHDQELDPKRIFKKVDNDSFVSDSRDFRRAVFEILIGRVSEEYYSVLGRLKSAESTYSDRKAAYAAYSDAVNRIGDKNLRADQLQAAIKERQAQIERLELTRAQVRRQSPNEPLGREELVRLREELADLETRGGHIRSRARVVREELVRLRSLEQQFAGEVLRIQKIIHTHETLGLFSPDTCPCCLRRVERPLGHCICGQAVDEASYQHYFYSSAEYTSILKARQKNVQTVRSAADACKQELGDLSRELSQNTQAIGTVDQQMKRWASISGEYTRELEGLDDALVQARVEVERLSTLIRFEQETVVLADAVEDARQKVETLRQRVAELELTSQEQRSRKVKEFEKVYAQLMRAALPGVHSAHLDAEYEPVLNDGEYREASASVSRRLMYYLTLLKMSLTDTEMPYPRFLLVDTPETAGIDREDLFRAVGLLQGVLVQHPNSAQVILTTGPGKYPPSPVNSIAAGLDRTRRLLRPRNPPSSA